MRASTAAEPTTSPPRMDTVCPMEPGRRSPASWMISKAMSRMSTSKMEVKGTSCLAAMMERVSLVGSISGWKVTAAI